MKDYSESLEPIRFKVNNDIFEAVASLPGAYVRELTSLVKGSGGVEELDNSAKLDAVFNFLDKILLPGSAERFAERMNSKTEPIGFKQVVNIFSDLLADYLDSETPEETEAKVGLEDESTRPTLGASSFSTGAVNTGTSSLGEQGSVASTSRIQISG